MTAVAAAAVGVIAVGAVMVGGLVPRAGSATTEPDAVQQGLTALVHDAGLPSASAGVRDGRGSRNYTAGVGDLATGAPVPVDGQVRIGSNTKAFTAVVVLQLVGEGKIALDSPVETYLPGLVRGDGIDGRRITVRELLQHTSGLPDYVNYIDDAALRDRYFEPRDLVDIALQHKADAAPGAQFGYSSTNYVLAGLIVEKVTGRPLAEEIDRHIIDRIGLRHTYFPAPGDRTIRGPHPHGYLADPASGPPQDFTEMDPSAGWAAGQMISTNSDLDEFFTALLAGRLLPPAQLEQMRTTVPMGVGGARYGLGIVSRPLSCGGVYWGHGGDLPGFETRGGATDSGRAANIAITAVPADDAVAGAVEKVVDTALCG
ncbi:serine hydrolase domain-containing protein [Speluncibacter jeojiensis]|uniref:serine hydrolase domain-containing protein n=1 Tax=Speluncibacter jeojiensis TaxID=2710754 RepID=UPI002410465F|nr:serine hydrolase domain-containing protein [Rhodococcus sp. D2-41]